MIVFLSNHLFPPFTIDFSIVSLHLHTDPCVNAILSIITDITVIVIN